MNLGFKSKKGLFSKIDALPQGPGWKCTPLLVKGDVVGPNGEQLQEVLEIWHRDPVELVQELVGNPNFKNYLRWSAEQRFRDEDGNIREYREMSSGDWWWNTQVRYICISRNVHLLNVEPNR